MALSARWREWLKMPATRQCVVKMAAVCLIAGMASAVIATAGLRSADHANARAVEAVARAVEAIDRVCRAGNERSLIQRTDLLTRRAQSEIYDFAKLFNLTAEQAENLRRLSLASIDDQITKLPFSRCPSGERLPPGELPPPTKGTP